MNSFTIPTFDFHRVIIQTWGEHGHLYGWVVLMGFLVAASCGLVGNYLVMRRMALVGDAISHSVLPGLAIAFLLAAQMGGGGSDSGSELEKHGHFHETAMFFGALLSGVLTTFLIEVIHQHSRVKQDAAIGITFSTLFALGIVLISLFADQVDLDQECVLHGEITYMAFEEPIKIWGVTLGPMLVIRMAIVTFLTGLWILLFYKELLLSSFDSVLATSLGINAHAIHYALMCWLSLVVVSAFKAVGAILVIAMLILPAATASLLSHRLPVIMGLSLLHAALSSVGGLHLAVWLDCSISGAMVVMGCILFLFVWIFHPVNGLLRFCWIRLSKSG